MCHATTKTEALCVLSAVCIFFALAVNKQFTAIPLRAIVSIIPLCATINKVL